MQPNADPDALTAVFAALPQGVVIFNRQRRLSILNPAAARLLATDADRCLGMSCENFAEQFGLPGAIGSEPVLIETDTIEFLVQMLALPEMFGTADVDHALLLSELSEEARLVSLLSTTLRFDVRPPLISVHGVTQLFQRGLLDPLPEQVPPIIEILSNATRLLQSVVRQCVWLTHPYHRNTRLVHMLNEPTDVGNLLQQELAQAQRTFKHVALNWEVALPDEPLLVHISDVLLRDALCELIENAGRFTDRGGTVRLRALRESDAVVISVGDTGSGIEPGRQEQIRSLLADSAGLRAWRHYHGRGLLIAHLAALRGNFSLSFESTPGQGTTFYLRLPNRSEAA